MSTDMVSSDLGAIRQSMGLEGELAAVDRAKRNSEAFGQLYERYYERIYVFAYARLKTRTEAEDATSEVFLKALGGTPGYRGTEQSFAAWLFRIATHVVVDRYRRGATASLEGAPDIAVESADIAEAAVQRARMRSVWAAVEKLPPQERMAITLRFSADLSNDTIASVMRKSTPAIKQLLYRGVHALRARLAVAEIAGHAAEGDLSEQSGGALAAGSAPMMAYPCLAARRWWISTNDPSRSWRDVRTDLGGADEDKSVFPA